MERKEFLRSLGAGAAFAVIFPCVQGCSKDETPGVVKQVPTNVDFTVDLNSAEAAPLQNNGGFILKNDVVVVKNLQGEFTWRQARYAAIRHTIRFASSIRTVVFFIAMYTDPGSNKMGVR